MKTIIRLAVVIAMVVISVSCDKEQTSAEQIEYVYAKVDFSGSITIRPLDSKSSNSSESFEPGDLLFLNVYRYKNDSFNGYQALASVQGGIYTDADNIVLPLVKGGYYQIIAFVVKDIASYATWTDFPGIRNQMIENKEVHFFSMMLNGKFVNHYKSYRGGQRIMANSDIDLNLKMVRSYFGVTLNYNDVKGDVMVFSDFTSHDPKNKDSYAIVSSGETVLMKFSETCNTGNSDKGRCDTFEEQCITTGYGAMYDAGYLRGFDIRIGRSLNGEMSYLNVINVEVKAGDNLIINIEEADFTGYSGNLSLDFSDTSSMNDVYYN